jgi:hypothetical protein
MPSAMALSQSQPGKGRRSVCTSARVCGGREGAGRGRGEGGGRAGWCHAAWQTPVGHLTWRQTRFVKPHAVAPSDEEGPKEASNLGEKGVSGCMRGEYASRHANKHSTARRWSPPAHAPT